MGIFLTLKKIPWVTKKEYLIIISNIINQKSNEKNISIWGLLVDPITNSPNFRQYVDSCMADREKN